jgi:ATP-dependent DNA helicase RecQ
VSHWGHDFRPEYRQLKAMFAQVPEAARMALTATATPQVQDDICAQLGLRKPARLVGHIDRPNLVFRALPRHEAAKQITEVIRRHPGEGGIVYAQTRKEVERIAARLAKDGVQCRPYHAGLDAAVRAKAQDDFVNERLPVVVATVAFGMGIDRSNVRYVVHANCPKSVEHYQQEAGRAGRDGLPAECVLLFSTADLVTHRALAEKEGRLPPDRKASLERQLRDIGRFAVAPVCRHRLLCEHFGQEYPLAGSVAGSRGPGAEEAKGCGACDVCLGETEALPGEEALVTAQKILSAVWRMGGRWGVGQVIDVLRGDATDKVRRAGHDQLSTFGLLKDQPETVLRAWIDQLAVQGHLALVEEDVYTFITLAEPGRALCKGQGEVRLGRFAVTRKGRTAGPRAAVASAQAGLEVGAAALFERLRELRRALATKQGVPPYLVFSDATLRGIAALAPASLDALRAVKGVGDSKLARYGAPVLAVVAGREPLDVAGAD